jgi:pumilio family protein 6
VDLRRIVQEHLWKSPTMAPKHSASAASAKRKSSSSDKYNDGNRAKKAKTVTAPKRQKFDEDEDMASDSDGSGFSDSGDGGAELSDTKPTREPAKAKENGRAFGQPNGAERSLFLHLTSARFLL